MPPTTTVRTRSRIWRRALIWGGMTVSFGVLAILLTWPVARHPLTHVAGVNQDRLLFVWFIRWFKEAWLELNVSPYFVPTYNYPVGYDLGTVTLSPTQMLSALPFAVIGGDVFAYNAVLLLSYILSALSMGIWVYYHTRRYDASLMAGMLFAFLPYRMLHGIAGHIELMGTQWLPLCFLGVDMLLDGKAGWRAGLLVGLAFGVTALTAQYYMVMTALLLVPYVLVGLGRHGWRNALKNWRAWAVAALAAIPLVALAEWPYIRASMSPESLPIKHSIAYALDHSASLFDLFVPVKGHVPWLRSYSNAAWPKYDWERVIYIGVIPLLFMVDAVRRVLLSKKQVSGLARMLAAFALAMLLAWGPYALLGGEPLRLAWLDKLLPASVSSLGSVPLPGLLLSLYLPHYSALRSIARFGIYSGMMAVALTGVLWPRFIDSFKMRPYRRALLVCCILVIGLLDVWPGPLHTEPVVATKADLWIAEQPEDGAVVYLPMARSKAGWGMLHASWTGKPYVGSFAVAGSTVQADTLLPKLSSMPQLGSLAYLRDLGVRYVCVHLQDYIKADQVVDALKSQGLSVAYQDGECAVLILDSAIVDTHLAMVAPPSPVSASPVAWLSSLAPQSGGWASQDTHLRLVGDVDGDGRDDLVGCGPDAVMVGLSHGDGFDAPVAWSAESVGAMWPRQSLFPQMLGDVNGDGRADLVGCGWDGVQVMLSAGERFAEPENWLTDTFSLDQGYTDQDRHPRFIGDVNGDGLDDLVAIGEDGVYVAVSGGDSFKEPRFWLSQMAPAQTWSTVDAFPRSMGDMDGDGRADLIGFGKAGVYLCRSTGEGLMPPVLWSEGMKVAPQGWSTQDAYPRMVGDLDGDGTSDVVGFGEKGVYRAVTQADGAMGPMDVVPGALTRVGGWGSQQRTPRLLGDVDGDGRDDIIAFGNRDVYVMPWQ